MENNEKFVDNIKPSTLETIDYALFNWINEKINPHCNSNDGFKKVPIVWSSAERSFQIKNYKELRDKDGSLITPFISIERNSITKALGTTKGAFQSNIIGNDRISYTSIINQEKTSKYANNDAYKGSKKINYALKKTPKVVYQTKSIRLPTYIDVEYSISIKTSFLQQINEILTPFITYNRAGKHFIIKNEGFSYEALLEDSFSVEESSSSMESEERKYVSKITVKVIGYLTDADVNENDQRVVTYENPVEFKFPKEDIIIKESEAAPKKRLYSSEGTQVGQTVNALKKVFLIGNGVDSIYEIIHNLDTRDMYVSVRLTDFPYDKVEAGIEFTSLSTIKLDTGVISNDYLTVVIIG